MADCRHHGEQSQGHSNLIDETIEAAGFALTPQLSKPGETKTRYPSPLCPEQQGPTRWNQRHGRRRDGWLWAAGAETSMCSSWTRRRKCRRQCTGGRKRRDACLIGDPQQLD
jgi:hypothetical protein